MNDSDETMTKQMGTVHLATWKAPSVSARI